MEEQIKQLNDRLLTLENRLNGLSNDPRQQEVIRKAVGEALKVEKFGLNKSPIGRQGNILGPAGGTTIDAEARTAINSILTLLDAFGFTS